MTRKELLDDYLTKHELPGLIVKKLDANSFLTENFAYKAFRIGNSIGDLLDISIEVILLDEIAQKFDLIFDTTEHAELHTKGLSEAHLDHLVKGAILFENIKNNKKKYKQSLNDIIAFIRKEMDSIINSK